MKKFVIPSGFHLSHVFPKFYFKKNLLPFEFMFTSSCKYDLNDVHYLDVNKLYGMSFGLIHNFTTLWGRIFKKSANSFRIGWNCQSRNGKIQLFGYYYNNGVRSSIYICDVDVNKVYSCTLVCDRATNKIMVDISAEGFASNSVFDFNFDNSPKYGFILFPFFGGTIEAPHRMTFFINQF